MTGSRAARCSVRRRESTELGSEVAEGERVVLRVGGGEHARGLLGSEGFEHGDLLGGGADGDDAVAKRQEVA
ncbi:hypothetical protein O0235_09315 [Tepidiforma flava]|uniref:Uncharacterized protein n=1 Tax=Tepidiforma flava TaxID=3004094 RepID=A0ABY7M2W0_9CHLR|nr:hypothetical protein [Tepidiforma flava]WBL34989.1 hypothetical protein O0235_09315 [Tepidiforma flava]